MELTKNFKLSEFGCKDGTPVPPHLYDNVQELATNLQVLRDHIGIPLHINSAFRTESYNSKVGGSPKSQHKLAKAADLRTDKHTPKQLAKIILQLIEEGKMCEGGVGTYPSFVHYDVRKTKARW